MNSCCFLMCCLPIGEQCTCTPVHINGWRGVMRLHVGRAHVTWRAHYCSDVHLRGGAFHLSEKTKVSDFGLRGSTTERKETSEDSRWPLIHAGSNHSFEAQPHLPLALHQPPPHLPLALHQPPPHLPLVSQQDALRLHIAVHNVVGVEVLEAAGNAKENLEAGVERCATL